MTLNFKETYAVVRRYLAPTITLCIVFVSAAGYLVNQYRNFYAEKETFVKYRSDQMIALNKQETEIEKREFILHQNEEKFKALLSDLQQKNAEYENSATKLRQTQLATNEDAKSVMAEERITKLMHEFSDLGVDMDTLPHCNDREAREKFARAKAKYDDIATQAEAYGLKKKFGYFLFHNVPPSDVSCISSVTISGM